MGNCVQERERDPVLGKAHAQPPTVSGKHAAEAFGVRFPYSSFLSSNHRKTVGIFRQSQLLITDL